MVSIKELSSRNDARGSSFTVRLPFDRVAESHVATIEPGHVRGNHFHREGRELLVILAADAFTLFFDRGEDSSVESRSFKGSIAVQAEFGPGSAHAVRNDGKLPLQIFVLADARRNHSDPDTYPRRLI